MNTCFLILFRMGAEFSGRNAGDLLEDPGEMVIIGKAYRIGNLCNRQSGFLQKLAGAQNPLLADVFGKTAV